MGGFTFTMASTCPHCGKDIELSAENIDPVDLAPDVRSRINPIGSVFIYRISSEQIKQFIIAKSKHYIPDVKIEVVPRYCEKRQKKGVVDIHRSYASLRIAFSEHVIEKNGDNGWFNKIGESAGNVRIAQNLFENIIKMYRYNKNEINTWTDSYKNLEILEEGFGMTEQYIADLKMYCTPKRVKTTNGPNYIIFSADPAKVIADMLTDYKTGEPVGRIQIQDIIQVSKDAVEFYVYVNPAEIKLEENPHVRAILMGDEKVKAL